MSVLRVMGTETEYGISVPGQPGANAMVTSSQIVNAYQAATAARARRARWDFEEENPLRDARGFDLTREAADSSQLTAEDLGLANVILTNGAQAKNVYWQVGSAATINGAGGGTFEGTIISQAGIAVSTAGVVAITTIDGRLIALGASTTLVNTVINTPAP